MHPLTPILIIGHPLSPSSIYNYLWHPLCSVYELDSPLGQPLSRSSLALGGPSTSYSMHFFTQSPSSFRSTCPYQCSLFCCNTSDTVCHLYLVSLSSLLGSLSFNFNATHSPDHSHLCLLKCHHIFFPYRPGLTSMQHAASTQLLYNLPLIIKDTSLLVSSGI